MKITLGSKVENEVKVTVFFDPSSAYPDYEYFSPFYPAVGEYLDLRHVENCGPDLHIYVVDAVYHRPHENFLEVIVLASLVLLHST